jgi:hypothetical protein
VPPEGPGQQDKRQGGHQASGLAGERDQARVERQKEGQQQTTDRLEARTEKVRDEDQRATGQRRDEARQKVRIPKKKKQSAGRQDVNGLRGE